MTAGALVTTVTGWIAILLGPQLTRVPWASTLPETAAAIAEVAEARPLPGATARETGAVLVVMSFYESTMDPDVWGDNHTAFGLFQIHAGTIGHRVPEDIKAQTWEAADLLATSWRVCSRHPLSERLAHFMAGHDCEHRLALSRWRMSKVATLLRGY